MANNNYDISGGNGLQNNEELKHVLKRYRHRFFLVWILYFFLFGCFVFILAAGILYWYLHRPIDVKNINHASSQQVAGWFVLRDLEKESQEVQTALCDRYMKVIQSDPENDHLEIDPMYIDWIRPVLKKRSDSAKKDWQGASVLFGKWNRQDYIIKVDANHSGKYVLPKDIQPGEDLIRMKAKKDRKNGSLVKIENNVQLLFRLWFVKKMNEYTETPDDQKAAFLEKTSEELLFLQKRYNNVLEQMGLPAEPRLSLLRNYYKIIASWYQTTSVEELAKILWFKDLLIVVTIQKSVKIPLLKKSYPPLRPEFKNGNMSAKANSAYLNQSGN
ncbi:MAG: hypothetical protein IKW74_00335 [Thermoguttaceae bacterium]|nr:hypothetical protein [Thermoguttaceae bacterium]